MTKYVVGVDFGTLSGRAVVVRVEDGTEVGSVVHKYPHGVLVSALPNGQGLPPDWALQVPQDYRQVLQVAVPAAVRRAGINPVDVVGIATDFTACTVLPTLDAAGVAATVVWKPVLTTNDAIRRQVLEANAADECIGVITWMHTFTPAKMWISGLDALAKPLLHLHTQAGVELPWDTIDMDFMNLYQAAHGDREFGHRGHGRPGPQGRRRSREQPGRDSPRRVVGAGDAWRARTPHAAPGPVR